MELEKCDKCGRAFKKFRSNEQNRYLHGYIIPEISETIGYTPEETKEILKFKFLKSFKVVLGIETEYVRGTSELSTVEMEKFLTEVREWASLSLGIYLKMPNEVLNDN